MKISRIIPIASGIGLLSSVDKDKLTGRETLYHNTLKENIPSILENGLKSSYSEDPKNITNISLKDIEPDKKKGLVYLAKSKKVADGVGNVREIKMNKPSKTIKLSINYDDFKNMHKVDNPELRGSKTSEEYWNNRPKSRKLGKKYEDLSNKEKKLVNKQFKGLDEGTIVIKGDVDPKYIKGSESYQPLTIEEFRDYIKNNPSRFGKEAGKLGAGLLLSGIGIKKLIKR